MLNWSSWLLLLITIGLRGDSEPHILHPGVVPEHYRSSAMAVCAYCRNKFSINNRKHSFHSELWSTRSIPGISCNNDGNHHPASNHGAKMSIPLIRLPSAPFGVCVCVLDAYLLVSDLFVQASKGPERALDGCFAFSIFLNSTYTHARVTVPRDRHASHFHFHQ